MTVFSTAPGQVARVSQRHLATPIRLDIEFSSTKAIVTQVAYEQFGNYKIAPSLDEFLYVYRFGDKVSELLVSGLCFNSRCNDSSAGTGMDDVLDFYHNNRVTKRTAPVKIIFGNQRLRGILGRSRIAFDRPELPIGQWAFQFEVVSAGSATASINTVTPTPITTTGIV